MYTRLLRAPRRPFFLFGPRGTGKTTWLTRHFPEALFIDLLPPQTALQYEKDPSFLRAQVLAHPKNRWVVVDEVQKVPSLLDEIHFLMERHGHKNFVLTGSSARKIKRGQANLLAGRAILLKMFPFNSFETNFALDPEVILKYGLLPLSVAARTHTDKESFLNAYVDTYLREEIKYEGIVRNLGGFSRFLEIASLCAGQQVNMSNLSREAEITRDTVRSYFSVFEDTLLGGWLPAYRARAKVKEVVNPKFYWFDCGVLNAAAGGFRQPMPSDWKGVLFENWMYHEMVSFCAYLNVRGSLGFWKTPSGSEIDFLWWYGQEHVAIEIKASRKFKREFLDDIRSFRKGKKLKSSWVVYLGDEPLKVDDTHVLPVMSFLKLLYQGKVIPFKRS